MQMWQSPAAPERRARRRKIFYPTTMQCGGAVARVHLLDLSASGALGHSSTPPQSGAVAQVALEDIQRAARVMWVEGERFGLAFTMPFTDGQVADLLAKIATAR